MAPAGAYAATAAGGTDAAGEPAAAADGAAPADCTLRLAPEAKGDANGQTQRERRSKNLVQNRILFFRDLDPKTDRLGLSGAAETQANGVFGCLGHRMRHGVPRELALKQGSLGSASPMDRG